jgi:hypothetical protein
MKKIAWSFQILLLVFFLSCKNRSGCTDPNALNYNPDATVDNGDCIYQESSIDPVKSLIISEKLAETSGLTYWDGSLFTHIDETDIHLYKMDTATANIEGEYPLTGAVNKDWEDLCQDRDYIYVGDFGNNLSGNRQDLHILRVHKQKLLLGEVQMDTIFFQYSDQDNFTPNEPNQTEYDCEAMISWGDHIFLFTKKWISGETSLYSLPKEPGSHEAVKGDSYLVNGLVSGATAVESEGLVVLCGYDKLLQPFLLLLYDFEAPDFFSGQIRKLLVSLPFHQVEGIAAAEELIFYLTNESYSIPAGTTIEQKCHRLDLSPFLE